MELKRCANCANGQWTNREAQVPEVCISCYYSADFEPSAWKPKVVTNADRIRAMTDDKLADWLARTQIANVAEALQTAHILWYQPPEIKEEVKKECLEWLQQPAEVE